MILENQVSGKNPKYTDRLGVHIYKKLSTKELDFYLMMKNTKISQLDNNLEQFIPQFQGVKQLQFAKDDPKKQKAPSQNLNEWIQHMTKRNKNAQNNEEYLILKNLTLGYQEACIMDIKLGRKKKQKASNKKFQKSTTNSHHFRINGMKNYDVESDEHTFINKYYFQQTTQCEIQSHLAFFFYNGNSIDTNLIKKCVEIIKKLVFSLLSFKKGSFHSSSLLFCYDGKNHNSFEVKLIDFDNYHQDDQDISDMNIIEGLKYIVSYLLSITEKVACHETVIKQKMLKFFLNQHAIPEKTIAKYEEQN